MTRHLRRSVRSLFLALGIAVLPASARAHSDSSWIHYGETGLHGTDGEVHDMVVDDSIVYVGGEFTHAGRVDARNVAVWDGHAWSALGEGCRYPVRKLALDRRGGVYAFGEGVPFSVLQKWDGREWRTISDSIQGSIAGMQVDSLGRLLLLGRKIRIGRVVRGDAVRWNGQGWRGFQAPGRVVADQKGRLFAYPLSGSEGLSVYRLQDSLWVEHGPRAPWQFNGEAEVMLGFDGSRRMVVFGRLSQDWGGQILLARLGEDGKWDEHIWSSEHSVQSIDFMMPVRGEPDHLWVSWDRCLRLFEADSFRETRCGLGPLLAPLNDGRLVTAGSWIRTASGEDEYIAISSGDHWVGVDSTGVAIRTGLVEAAALLRRKLFDRIPVEGRPPRGTSIGLSDVQMDSGGGMYFAGRFWFERNGTFFNNVAYWKDGVPSPVGGGLFGDQGRWGIQLAPAPDGSLYAGNAALYPSASVSGLYRWDGKAWHFVRRTAPIGDMAFDSHGNLFALVSSTDGSSGMSFCRIPVDSPGAAPDCPAGAGAFVPFQPERLEIEDSLVHLRGDFVRVLGAYSPGHVAWRIPESLRTAKRIPRAAVADRSQPLRILWDPGRIIRIAVVDSAHVMQYDHYDLYNTTPHPVGTVDLLLREVEGLRLFHSGGRSSYFLPDSDFTIKPIERGRDGYRVRVVLRDSIPTGSRIILGVTTTRRGRIARISADSLLLKDTIRLQVADLYDHGAGDSFSVRITGSGKFLILGRHQPRGLHLGGARSFKPLERLLMPVTGKDCDDRDTPGDPPDSLPGDEVLAVVLGELGYTHAAIAAVSEWPHCKGCHLVLVQSDSDRTDEPSRWPDLTLALVSHRRVGCRPRLIARHAGFLHPAATWDAACFPWVRGERLERIAFDSVPFVLSKERRGFGVRLASSRPDGAGGRITQELLTLFLVRGDGIRPILAVPTSRSGVLFGPQEPDGTRTGEVLDGRCEIVADPQPGYSDPDLLVKTGEGGRGTRFVWDLDRYVPECHLYQPRCRFPD